MKTIILTGVLAIEFGRNYEFDCHSPAEALRALVYQMDGFEAALKEGAYHVFRTYENGEHDINEMQLSVAFGNATGMRIEPVIAGAKAGMLQTILGVALVGAAVFFSGGVLAGTAFSVLGMGVSYGQIALVGGMLAISGASQMYSAAITDNPDDHTDERKSFIIDAPRNLIEQGHPVPLIYGRCFTGSIVIATGITTEEFDDG